MDEVLHLFQQICSGVAAAHAKGIVHRDLKPDNIFLRSNGSIAVADFGLCYFLDEDERVTFTEEAVGPRWYMAPELEDGRTEHITPRCDVYSLGKVLYWMLAGRIFSREKHRDPQYYLAKDSRNSADYLVYELLDRTIVAEPSQRIANATELSQEVATLRRRVATGAHAIGKSVPQPCSYCGLGMYRVIADKERSMNVRNFGFELVGNPDWIIMACDYCANIQIFRPDANRRGAVRAKNEPWEK